MNIVKPVLSGHSKNRQNKGLNGSLMKVESIAVFCNSFGLHKAIIGFENRFWCSSWMAA